MYCTIENLFKKGDKVFFNPHAFNCKAPETVQPGEHVVIEVRDAKHLYGSTGWGVKTNKCPNLWVDQGWFLPVTEASRIKLMPEEDRKFFIMVKQAEKTLPLLKQQFKDAQHKLIDSLFS